jgi:hypothetical protein
VIIYLHDKRRQFAEFLRKIRYLVGGVPLLLNGARNLADAAERPRAILEIAVALVVLAAFIKETR